MLRKLITLVTVLIFAEKKKKKKEGLTELEWLF